jgi:hypothetical protein
MTQGIGGYDGAGGASINPNGPSLVDAVESEEIEQAAQDIVGPTGAPNEPPQGSGHPTPQWPPTHAPMRSWLRL